MYILNRNNYTVRRTPVKAHLVYNVPILYYILNMSHFNKIVMLRGLCFDSKFS